MSRIGFALLFLSLTACQVVNGPDVPATLQYENAQIVLEATAIAQDSRSDRAAVEATADASMTRVAEIQGSNLVLLSTVRAGDPPSVRVVASTDERVEAGTPGQPWFLRTGLSQFVDPADGCVLSPQISFTTDTPIIYMTLKAYNAIAGTQLTAVWEHESTEMFRDSMVISNNASEMCVWLSIDHSEAEFIPGSWIVRVYAGEQQLDTPVVFEIRDAGAMDGG